MSLRSLIRIEISKANRSLAMLMMVVSPLMVTTVNSLMLFNRGPEMIIDKGWELFWMGNHALWSYFMFPLYVALVTALLNGIEHKSQGWRFMLSLPVQPWKLFLAKLSLAWLYCLGACLSLFLSVLAAIGVLTLLGFRGEHWLSISSISGLIYALGGCSATLVIQHIVSWRWQNIVVPLGLGVMATMSIVQLASSKYWVYSPWVYTLTASNASDVSNRYQALTLSATISIVLTLAGCLWLGRREVSC